MIITNIRIVKNKVLISINNNQNITLPVETSSNYSLKEGFFISKELLEKLKQLEKENEAFNYAITLLKRRDYFKIELKQKLNKKQYDKKTTLLVINKLERLHYFNDEQLVNRLIEKYNNKNYSNKNIIARLLKRGLSIKDFKNKLNNEEKEIIKAKEVVISKSKSLEAKGRNVLKTNLGIYLRGKGYSTNVIIKVLEELELPQIYGEYLKNEIKSLSNKLPKNIDKEKRRKLVFKKLINKGYNYSDIEKEMENIDD